MNDIQIERFKGDGSQRTVTVTYPIGRIVEVCVDDNPVSVGYKGIDSGKQAYYSIGSDEITFDSPPGDVEVIYRLSWEANFVSREPSNITIKVFLDGKAIAGHVMSHAMSQLKNR